MSRARIVVFAKAPEAGRAKTRLIPALGAAGAARLAEQMLRMTVAEALAAEVGTVEICASPAPGSKPWQRVRLPDSLIWSFQGTGDLGDRMARAARRAVDADERVLLIGADCPGLDRHRLRWAADALDRVDAVVYPTCDGGYALLGLRRFAAALFAEIAWSTASVAATTLARIAALRWTVDVGAVLRDIDTPADLEALPPAMRSAAGS